MTIVFNGDMISATVETEGLLLFPGIYVGELGQNLYFYDQMHKIQARAKENEYDL